MQTSKKTHCGSIHHFPIHKKTSPSSGQQLLLGTTYLSARPKRYFEKLFKLLVFLYAFMIKDDINKESR